MILMKDMEDRMVYLIQTNIIHVTIVEEEMEEDIIMEQGMLFEHILVF